MFGIRKLRSDDVPYFEVTRVVGIWRGGDLLSQSIEITQVLAHTAVYALEIRIPQHVVKGSIFHHKHKNMLNLRILRPERHSHRKAYSKTLA